jgi:tricorn protease
MKALALVLLIVAHPLVLMGNGVNIHDTRMLTQPAISKTNIAFVYAGDLWVADIDGRNVRRLTTDQGLESNPAFSPDGTLLAFNAQYEGNVDVYTVPVTGGVPTRLTWHPGPDFVQGFTPDARRCFLSPRGLPPTTDTPSSTR